MMKQTPTDAWDCIKISTKGCGGGCIREGVDGRMAVGACQHEHEDNAVPDTQVGRWVGGQAAWQR